MPRSHALSGRHYVVEYARRKRLTSEFMAANTDVSVLQTEFEALAETLLMTPRTRSKLG